jgi:hypothetical protein
VRVAHGYHRISSGDGLAFRHHFLRFFPSSYGWQRFNLSIYFDASSAVPSSEGALARRTTNWTSRRWRKTELDGPALLFVERPRQVPVSQLRPPRSMRQSVFAWTAPSVAFTNAASAFAIPPARQDAQPCSRCVQFLPFIAFALSRRQAGLSPTAASASRVTVDFRADLARTCDMRGAFGPAGDLLRFPRRCSSLDFNTSG